MQDMLINECSAVMGNDLEGRAWECLGIHLLG